MAEQLRKPIIVFVDHEKTSLNDVIKGIGKQKRSLSTMKPVRDSCELIGVLVNDTPRNTLCARAKKKIDTATSRVNLILVDLSFDRDSRESKSVEYGRELALGLKEHFKGTAVGVYSKYPLYPRDRAIISAEGFALVLESVGEMFDEKSSYALTGDVWFNLFDKAIETTREAFSNATPPHALSVPNPQAKWAEGHPAHRSRSFIEAAPKLADLALEWLPEKPGPITITELGGGFSGAYVVRATLPDRTKSFVIKIDEDPVKLEKELEGYQIFNSRVNDKYFLPIATHSIRWPVRLYGDWWAAFAMSYEGSARPLLEHSVHTNGESLAEIYKRIWDKCLFDLYGEVLQKQTELTHIITSKDLEFAKEGVKALERYRPRLPELSKDCQTAFNRTLSLIHANSIINIADNNSIEVDWVNQIHGDLNCRNILYDQEDKSLRLIDFPNVSPNCLAVDFVKAEAELILIMLDWLTGLDCDILQLNRWRTLTEVISSSFTPSECPLKDAEIERILSAIVTIRDAYSNKSSAESRESYRLYLLGRVLRYTGYSDITISKRFLALIWAGQLLNMRW
jgi:hypothetical protein